MTVRPYLASRAATLAVLERHKFTIQKKYGQNFLINAHVPEKIIEAADITKDDFVLEIGPGIGTLTQYLSAAAREVTAVEIDDELIGVLEDTLRGFDNVTVLHEDILKTDIARIANEKNKGRDIKVAANLPYYITSPIILKLLEGHLPIESITVMVQKEVADRISSGPGTKDYGSLSLAVQYYAKPETVVYAGPECFMPRPKVGSAVINLKRYLKPPVKTENETLMFEIIRAAFNQRRKTLANALGNNAVLNLTKDQALDAIAAIGKGENVRGEALTLAEFAALADECAGIMAGE